ncbi:MAG: response regulator [bacterium]|nr:response regulator [bacterium]
MKKILIIEDDLVLSQTISANLIHEGLDIEIMLAHDGEEGLASALSAKPDLILLDIILPKMDGITMLNALRKDEWGKGVPVIVLSNLSAPENVTAAVIDDVREYLVKVDWKIADVVKRVREMLKL